MERGIDKGMEKRHGYIHSTWIEGQIKALIDALIQIWIEEQIKTQIKA